MDIDGAGGAMTTPLANDTVTELADETILMPKLCMSGGVGGNDNDMGEVEVECKQDGVSGMDGLG